MTKKLVDSGLLERLHNILNCGAADEDIIVDAADELRAVLNAPQQEAVVTDEMVEAYLGANKAYWFQYDKIEAPIGKWCAGTVADATRVSLLAALKLYTHPAPSVPEGWQLVPKEPTPKMIDATWGDPIETSGQPESHNTRNHRVYRAMLSAAPKDQTTDDRKDAELPTNIDPDAWETKCMCIGPNYGKSQYGKLPIQSSQPGYYTHIKLYSEKTVIGLMKAAYYDGYTDREEGVRNGVMAYGVKTDAEPWKERLRRIYDTLPDEAKKFYGKHGFAAYCAALDAEINAAMAAQKGAKE